MAVRQPGLSLWYCQLIEGMLKSPNINSLSSGRKRNMSLIDAANSFIIMERDEYGGK